MRYFTRGWASGELSDDEIERARSAYWSRIDEIAPLLPPAVCRLAREVRLHDGLLERVVWNPSSRLLCLSVVCEDARGTTVQAELTYRGAMLGAARVESLRRAALSRETELLYDEVDIDGESVLSHRLLFEPSEEVTIDFRELDLVVSPRPDRRVHLGPAFLVENADQERGPDATAGPEASPSLSPTGAGRGAISGNRVSRRVEKKDRSRGTPRAGDRAARSPPRRGGSRARSLR